MFRLPGAGELAALNALSRLAIWRCWPGEQRSGQTRPIWKPLVHSSAKGLRREDRGRRAARGDRRSARGAGARGDAGEPVAVGREPMAAW